MGEADSPAHRPMAPPAEAHPYRPLLLAARSTRLLGVLFLLIGVLTPVPSLRQGVSVFELPQDIVVASLTHVLPGLAYLVCSLLLRRRRRTGLIVAFGLTLAHTIMVVGNLAAYFRLLLLEGHGTRRLFISLVVGFLVVAALGQLMWHLVKSFRVVKPPGPDELYFSEFGDDYDYDKPAAEVPPEQVPQTVT